MRVWSLSIADVDLPLRFRDPSILEAVREEWGAFLQETESGWAVEVSAAPSTDLAARPLPPPSMRWEGGTLRFSSPFFCGVWAGAGGGGFVEVSSDRRYLACSLENALRFLFSIAALDRGRVLLHAAAVLHRDLERALLFFGDSGTGKTTSASLSLSIGHGCLGDDLVLVGLDGGRVRVDATPFWGDLGDVGRDPGSAPVGALFSLRPSPDTGIERLSGADAVSSVVASVPFMEGRGRGAYGRLMEAVGGICLRVPVALLRFRPEAAFMQKVELFLEMKNKNF